MTIAPDNAVVNSSVDTVLLRCLSPVDLGVMFEWAFNGITLENETTENLTLTEVTPRGNGGHYTCNVSNHAGSGIYTTNLFFNPVITASPMDEIAINGSLNVTLTCSATAYPTPQYEWFKENDSLPSSSVVYINVDTSTLIIPTVEFRDEGSYYCNATANNISVMSYMATLHGKCS